ncbi:MAG: hypothetical protein K2X77_29940 [Candidatus Obscuribacterales bacterium]|jgi:hypothetical protein|nr:hypothetical protein [Candidatus Obscuribacterales bacterium]
MASDSDNEVSSRASDNVGEQQEGSSERHERMLDETQQGSTAEEFGRQSSEQRAQDSKSLVQNGALPDLMIDSSFDDPALDAINQSAGNSNGGNRLDQSQGAGRDNFGFHQGAAGRDKGAEKKNDASDKPADNALTPPEPVTFKNIQPSGYIPGNGGIDGGDYDMKGRIAPNTANFFDKKNPSDYVAMAIDSQAHVKDGQLFYSKELDAKYANQLAEKYPDLKPEDRHMWLRAVDTGSAFRNTWGANGPTRADIAVPNQQEASDINKDGHAKKNPSNAISLTMVPESDKDRVAALSKMPTIPGQEKYIRGKDFGYRDEQPKPRRR